MPPKRGIQVRFLSAGPLHYQNLSTGTVDKSLKVFVSHRFVKTELTCLNIQHEFIREVPKKQSLNFTIDF